MKSRQSTVFSPLLLLLFVAAFLSACGEKKAAPHADAPWLDFECSFASANGCDSQGDEKIARIGLIEDLIIDCASHLAGLSNSQFAAAFDYSTQTQTNLSGGIITGIAARWVNSQQMPVINLPKKTYSLCAYIDINENGQVDLNEPFLEDQITIGEDFLPLTNWSNF